MKIKKIFSLKRRSIIAYASILLLSSLLFSSYTNIRIKNFLKFYINPTATISVDKENTCIGEASRITFTGTNGTEPYTFTYTINNGPEKTRTTEVNNNFRSIVLDTTLAKDYIFRLIRITDNTGTSQIVTNQSVTVQVNSPPSVDFSFTNNNACAGETIQFTNTSTGTTDLTYNWDFGDSITSSAENPSHIFNVKGCGTTTFDVKLTVTDKNGCTNTITKPISVEEKPDIKFRDDVTGLSEFSNCGNTSTSSADYEITVGNISNSSCISSFSIDWGDGSSTNSATFPAKHTYSSVGVFEMKITAEGDNGCKSDVTYQVKNVSNPGGGFASPGNTTNLCVPTTALDFGITNWGTNSNDTEYIINFGDGTTETYTQTQLESSVFYNSANPENSDTFPTPHSYSEGTCSETGGEFVATLTVRNACGSTDFTISNITVLEKSVVSFEAVEESCINTKVIFENTSLIADGANCIKTADFIWDFGDGTVTKRFSVDNAVDEEHTYTTPGKYTVSLTIDSFCTTETFTKEICIEPEITPAFTLNTEEGCVPLAISSTNTTDKTGLCSTPIYKWTVTYNAENCGTSENWSFTNGTNENSENPIFIFNNPGKYTLTQSTTTNCGTKLATKTIDVKKPPTVKIDKVDDVCGAITINPKATVENCTTNTSSLSYKWTFTGGSPATSTALNPGNITYATSGKYTISLEVTNDCGVPITTTEEFEVFDKPTITNTNLTQEICSTQNISEIVLTADVPTATFKWTATASAGITGFTPNGTTNTIPVQNLVNSGNTAGTVKFLATPILDNCEGDVVEFTITVNPAPLISEQPTSFDVCLNGTANELKVESKNGIGTPTYQWYSNTVDANSGGNEITGETNATYTPLTTTVGDTFYYVEVSFATGGCSVITSNTAKVTVVPQPIVNAVSAPQTICVGGTAKELEVSFSGGTGTPNYQWFSNTTNSNSGGIQITGARDATFTPNAFSTVGTFYFYAEIMLNGSDCNSVKSDVFQINVVPDPIIDLQPIATQELCQNSTPTDLMVTVSGGTSSAYSYQWYSNVVNSIAGGRAIVGETNAVYKPNTSVVGTFYYYVEVFQPESNCTVTSEISELIINKAPIISSQPASSEICLNGTAEELKVAFTDGVGTPTYQWFSNTIDTNSGGTLIVGETNSTYTPITNTLGATFYYVEISFATGGCSKVTSNTAEIKVVKQPTTTSTPTSQIICVGGTPNEMILEHSGGSGIASYQWFSNTVNSNSGGNAISGATSKNYTPTVLNTVGNYFYYAEISFSGNGCNRINSAVYQVDVLQDPIIDSQPILGQELCQTTTPTNLEVTISGGTSSAYSYQWFRNNTNNNLGGTLIAGANGSSFSPPTNTIGTFYYYVVISQPESGCRVSSSVSSLKVNEAPKITKQPVSSEVCLNEKANLLEVEFSNGVGAPTYQWFSNTTNSNAGGTPISGETNSSYNPSTSVAGTNYFYVEIYFSSGGCSQVISNTSEVIVNEIPVVNSAEITIYSGATFNFNPNSIAGNTIPTDTKYTWSLPTISPTGSISGATSETSPQIEISQTLENTTLAPSTAIYKVTPATNTCTGNEFTLKVTINPSITPNVTIKNNTCFKANNGAIETNITGGIPFETGNPYLISWVGPDGFSSSDASIFNLKAGTYSVRIEDKDGFVFTNDYLITQPDTILITTDVEKNISCFEGNNGTIEVSISGGTANYTYNWSTLDGSGIVANAKKQETLTAGTYTLQIVDANNCTTSKNFTLSQPDGMKIETLATQNVLCFGEDTGSIEITVSGGTPNSAFDYNYSWAGPNGFTSNLKNIDNLIAGTYQVEVTDALGCTSKSSIIINQSTKIDIAVTKKDVTCYGAEDGQIDIVISGGNAPYTISWSNLANGNSLKNLSADTYTVRVTDKNNCLEEVAIIIEEPQFSIDPVVTPISCNGKTDGSISLNLSGGIAPISVTWQDDATAGLQRNNLPAGTYKVVIVDSDTNQCPIEETFTLTEPTALSVSEIITEATDCDTIASGSIDLTVSGGTEPYTFIWNNGATTEDLENIPQGKYTVEITDFNKCKTVKDFDIFRQEPINIEFIETKIVDCDTKTSSQKTEAIVTGGFLPYNYSWSAGNVSAMNESVMTTTETGSYSLTITDNRGCTATKSLQINVATIGSPDFQYKAFALDTYDLLSIEDPIEFTNLSSGNYTNVRWDFGDGSPTSNEENPIHTYDEIGIFKIILMVDYDAGCTLTFEREVNITKGYSLVNPTAFTPNGDGFNDYIRPVFNGFIDMEMSVYDSWGTKVYSEKGTTIKGWDGFINGKPAENGNYIMTVKGITFYEKEIVETKPVTLLK